MRTCWDEKAKLVSKVSSLRRAQILVLVSSRKGVRTRYSYARPGRATVNRMLLVIEFARLRTSMNLPGCTDISQVGTTNANGGSRSTGV